MKTERKTRAAGGFRLAAIQSAPRLAFHTRRRSAFNQLPFVDKDGLSGWEVPASGGEFGGFRTGEALAAMFLKHLREHGNEQWSLELLCVVRGMARRYEEVGGEAMAAGPLKQRSDSFNSLNGQMVGFFGEIGRVLVLASRHMGAPLDNISNEMLLEKANAGLLGDDGQGGAHDDAKAA